MASPYFGNGTFVNTLSSGDLDIINEKIILNVDNGKYIVEYLIKSSEDGKQIPLLFHAIDYKGDFKVWVDDTEVQILGLPDDFDSSTPFGKYHDIIKSYGEENAYAKSDIAVNGRVNYFYLKDLLYFEVDMQKGQHTIRVEYTASPLGKRSNWIKELTYTYSLAPAKYWRSFGELEIVVQNKKSYYNIETDLGAPTSGSLSSEARWHCKEIPKDKFSVICTPDVNFLADILIFIGPFWLTVLASLPMFIFHWKLVKKYRIQFPERRSSKVVIVGSIIIPLLILIFSILSYDMIDFVIGPAAGRYHGYVFFNILLYPVLLPFYWIPMTQLDKILKNKLNQK